LEDEIREQFSPLRGSKTPIWQLTMTMWA